MFEAFLTDSATVDRTLPNGPAAKVVADVGVVEPGECVESPPAFRGTAAPGCVLMLRQKHLLSLHVRKCRCPGPSRHAS